MEEKEKPPMHFMVPLVPRKEKMSMEEWDKKMKEVFHKWREDPGAILTRDIPTEIYASSEVGDQICFRMITDMGQLETVQKQMLEEYNMKVYKTQKQVIQDLEEKIPEAILGLKTPLPNVHFDFMLKPETNGFIHFNGWINCDKKVGHLLLATPVMAFKSWDPVEHVLTSLMQAISDLHNEWERLKEVYEGYRKLEADDITMTDLEGVAGKWTAKMKMGDDPNPLQINFTYTGQKAGEMVMEFINAYRHAVGKVAFDIAGAGAMLEEQIMKYEKLSNWKAVDNKPTLDRSTADGEVSNEE